MTQDPKHPRAEDSDERPPLTIEGAVTEIQSTPRPDATGDATASEPYREIGSESDASAKPGDDDAEPLAGDDTDPEAEGSSPDLTASAATSEMSPEEEAVAAAIDIRPGDDSEPVLSNAETVTPEDGDAVLDLRPADEPSLSEERHPSDLSTTTPIDVRPDPTLDAANGGPQGFDEPGDTGSPPPPPRRRGGFFSHMSAGVLGGILGVLAAGLVWPWIEERLQISAVSPQFEQMDERLTRLEAQSAQAAEGEPATALDVGALDGRIEEKLAPIRDQVAGLGQAGAAGGGGEQLAALEARVEALARAEAQAVPEVEPKITALDERAAALDKRVSALEAKLPDVTAKVTANAAESRNAALVIAVANLRGAVGSGRPYRNELDTLKSLAKGGLDLEALEARAGNGVPSAADVEQRFAASAPAAKKAEAKAVVEDRSWGGRLVDNARSLVKVKRNGEEVEGTPAAAALDRAADWLKGGDLAQAVREVEQLQGPAAAAMNGWLGSARARLGAEEALGRLQQSASTAGSRR